jgi:hypothetical protein
VWSYSSKLSYVWSFVKYRNKFTVLINLCTKLWMPHSDTVFICCLSLYLSTPNSFLSYHLVKYIQNWRNYFKHSFRCWAYEETFLGNRTQFYFKEHNTQGCCNHILNSRLFLNINIYCNSFHMFKIITYMKSNCVKFVDH